MLGLTLSVVLFSFSCNASPRDCKSSLARRFLGSTLYKIRRHSAGASADALASAGNFWAVGFGTATGHKAEVQSREYAAPGPGHRRKWESAWDARPHAAGPRARLVSWQPVSGQCHPDAAIQQGQRGAGDGPIRSLPLGLHSQSCRMEVEAEQLALQSYGSPPPAWQSSCRIGDEDWHSRGSHSTAPVYLTKTEHILW